MRPPNATAVRLQDARHTQPDCPGKGPPDTQATAATRLHRSTTRVRDHQRRAWHHDQAANELQDARGTNQQPQATEVPRGQGKAPQQHEYMHRTTTGSQQRHHRGKIRASHHVHNDAQGPPEPPPRAATTTSAPPSPRRRKHPAATADTAHQAASNMHRTTTGSKQRRTTANTAEPSRPPESQTGHLMEFVHLQGRTAEASQPAATQLAHRSVGAQLLVEIDDRRRS